MQRYLTYLQVAEILNCGDDKVRELCDLEELERISFGYRTKRVTSKSVEAYIRRQQQKQQRHYREVG